MTAALIVFGLVCVGGYVAWLAIKDNSRPSGQGQTGKPGSGKPTRRK